MGADKLWDLLVLGAGPAGITASVYAARKGLEFCILTGDVGGMTAASGDIENYTGYQFITGPELVKKFRDHLEQFKVDLREGEPAQRVVRDGDLLRVETARGRYRARTVILATGRTPRLLDVPGEAEYRNRGVTYCAICDGPLYAGMPVAIIGGGNSAFDAALQMMNIATRVTVIDIASRVSADPVMVAKARASGRVEILTGAKVTAVRGEKFVTGLELEREGKAETLAVEGVFVEIGSVPVSGLAPEVDKNRGGEIIVNCQCETNVPGLFAAGDVTNVYAKQIIIACGEGAKAALAAAEYLARR